MNQNIKKLMEFMGKNRFANYPIRNKELAASEDYVKNLYLKMLAVIMQQADETGELQGQDDFFARIVSGVHSGMMVPDYRRQALEIEVEDFRKFTEALAENPLKYRFVVDALLLTGIGSQSNEQKQLLVGLIEFLNISKAEATYLVRLSRSILMQDSAEYNQAEAGRPKNISFELFLEYTTLYVNILSNNEDAIYASYPEKMGFALEADGLCAKKIYLNNFKITLQKALSFEMADTVIIENCDFSGRGEEKNQIKYSYISITGNTKVKFIGCKFTDFQHRVIEEKGNKEINFENCLFENCYKERDGYSGVINSVYYEKNKWTEDNDIYLKFKNCIFRNCGFYGRQFACYGISNAGAKVENCTFFECLEDDDVLFPRGSININNTIDKGVKFQED